MELSINKNGAVIDSTRLFTVTQFAKISGFNYSTVRSKMFTGELDYVIIAEMYLVIKPESDDYKNKRKAGRKPKNMDLIERG